MKCPPYGRGAIDKRFLKDQRDIFVLEYMYKYAMCFNFDINIDQVA